MPTRVTAAEVRRATVYHSPQTPGFTCWAGTWVMPDGRLMVSFHQATGPLHGRPLAPKALREMLEWPPPGLPDGYDMTGADQQIIHLASADGGETWTEVSAEPFHSPFNGCTCAAETALPDGTVLRAVLGEYLPFYDVPQTGYIQRSTDGARTFGPPEVISTDDKVMTYPVRLRVLRDGRVAMSGAVIPLGPDVRKRTDWMRVMRPVVWVSEDAGRHWAPPVEVLPRQEGIVNTEECDFAELADGSLLFVERTDVPERHRWQSLLAPEGRSYRLDSHGLAPFPPTGCPEMLATREGLVLHVASSGISWTADGGKTWGDLGLQTLYYPKAAQLPDGRVFCVFHRGSDDPYDGSVDQEIQSLTFRLKAE
jgi:hypothetical protein